MVSDDILDRVDAQPPQSDISESHPLKRAWRANAWRVVIRADSIELVFRALRDGSFRRFDGDSMILEGTCGTERFTLALPRALADAVLSRGPEGFLSRDLSSDEGALVIEYLLARPIVALEQQLGLSVAFGGLSSYVGEIGEANPLEGLCTLAGRSYPIRLSVPGPEARLRLTQLIVPGTQPLPAMKVALGPITLTQSEINGMQAGDIVAVSGARFEKLKGAIFADADLFWPVILAEGLATIVGDLVIATDDVSGGNVQVFVDVGFTEAGTTPQPGTVIPFNGVDGKRVSLFTTKAKLSIGEVVSANGEVAVRILSVGAT